MVRLHPLKGIYLDVVESRFTERFFKVLVMVATLVTLFFLCMVMFNLLCLQLPLQFVLPETFQRLFQYDKKVSAPESEVTHDEAGMDCLLVGRSIRKFLLSQNFIPIRQSGFNFRETIENMRGFDFYRQKAWEEWNILFNRASHDIHPGWLFFKHTPPFGYIKENLCMSLQNLWGE
mmetsp:Transcript_1471/g.1889  ORF Transcript_1471/g.1889 Transcript_1471/m.1889 type:complete len:176 (+) Transcript_1471:270-797(+)